MIRVDAGEIVRSFCGGSLPFFYSYQNCFDTMSDECRRREKERASERARERWIWTETDEER